MPAVEKLPPDVPHATPFGTNASAGQAGDVPSHDSVTSHAPAVARHTLPTAITAFEEAVARDPLYSAAWKLLGKTLTESQRTEEALAAYQQGITAAKQKGDRQAEKEMTVFARRLEKGKA